MRLLRLMAAMTLITAAIALGPSVRTVQAEPLNPDNLAAHGWTCFQTPPFVIPPHIVCANQGLGRPFPGNPDQQPSYMLLQFDLGGVFTGTTHLIRADLYQNQTCSRTGQPYIFRALIGYYECVTP